MSVRARFRRAATGLLASLACLVLSGAGCDRTGSLPSLPAIALASFEPAVRAQLEGALARLEEAPGDAARNGELARLLHAYDRLEEAAVCYRRAAELAPREATWWYGLADTALRRGECEEGRRALERAISCADSTIAMRLRLGEALLESGDVDGARRVFEEACRRSPAPPRALAGRGEVASRSGDLAAARRDYEAALAADPSFAEVRYRLAQTLRRLGDEPGAADELERYAQTRGRERADDSLQRELDALRVDSDHLFRRANAHFKRGENDAAIALYRRLTEERGELVMPWYNLGLALQQEGRHADAVPAYEEFLARRPGSPDALNNLGLCHLERGELEPALGRFREAAAADASYWKAHFNEGLVHARSGAPAEAIGAFARALELQPADVESHYNLAVLHRANGDRERSERHAVAALRIDPADARVATLLLADVGAVEDGGTHRRLALSLRRHGLPAAANAVLRRRYEEAPDDYRSALALAWSLATGATGSAADAREAVAIAEGASHAAPSTDPIAYDVLAATYAAAGRFEEARRAIDEALRRAEDAGGEELMRRLQERRGLYEDGKAFREGS